MGQEDAAEVVMLCCAIKPMCGWNCERAGTVCRERCGGQGYLSCNRFGHIIGFAHATVTAEGDNRVLMQKVAKELLAASASSPAVQSRLQSARSSGPQVRDPNQPIPISGAAATRALSSSALRAWTGLYVSVDRPARPPVGAVTSVWSAGVICGVQHSV